LPAYHQAQLIVDTISNNVVTIVSGDTGCGKSTQTPQFILDHPTIGPTANIIITQPRRISAMGVAERVASERCEDVGQTVGYAVRNDVKCSDRTQLLFVTPGVLQAKLRSDRTLSEYTHVIIDEVHERDKYAEFLMIILKDLITSGQNNNLRVVLMSATVQTSLLVNYWRGCNNNSGLIGSNKMLPTSSSSDVNGTMAMHKLSSVPYDNDCDGDGDGNNELEVSDKNSEENNSDNSRSISDIQQQRTMHSADETRALLPKATPEICIPGRAFPVQEFFLEDVLNMTGFVDDVGSSDMVQLEQDLAKLVLQQQPKSQHQTNGTNRGGGGGGDNHRRRGKKNDVSANNNHQSSGLMDNNIGTSMLSDLNNNLTCIMCNKHGFRCPEELGSHVALCDGGGNITMEELEIKMRGDEQISEEINMCSIKDDEYDVDFDNTAPVDYDDSDDDDDDERQQQLKWNGTDSFVGNTAVQNRGGTLTEEEMLQRYQEHNDDGLIDDALLLETVRYIVDSSYGDGAILIFFPGWQEITSFHMVLDSTPPLNNRSKFRILPLHSGIPSREQKSVFVRPPQGTRKIILSTNIAETSITIDDVAFVVDTGRAKEKSYDPHLNTSTLQPVWISQASAKQRKGRAGRTKAGVCFHLFSRRRHSSMRPFLESEMLRTPLEEMCLQCKTLGVAPGGADDNDGISAFLSRAMTPPHPKSVLNALESLIELGAMEPETNELTSLGNCLSALSLEPRVGKMVIWSYLLGCANMGISMGAAMSFKSPFVLPPGSMRRNAELSKVALSEKSESDQITILHALQARDTFTRRGRQSSFQGYCNSNFLSINTLQTIGDLRKNCSRELMSLGFPLPTTEGYHTRNGNSDPAILQSTIAAGLYPNVASRRQGEVKFSTITNRKAKVHVSSVNACKGQRLNGKCTAPKDDIEFIAFGEMVRGMAFFTMSLTSHLASPLPLLLLCGRLTVRPMLINVENNEVAESKSTNKSYLEVDDWIVFQCDKNIATNLVVLRKRLDSAFLKLVANPAHGMNLAGADEKDAVEILSAVLKSAHTVMYNR